MKKCLLIVLMLIGAILAGSCQTNDSIKASSIADYLESNDISRNKITKIVLQGSESSVGSNVAVTITDELALNNLWGTLKQSYPSKGWCMCLLGTVYFFTGNSNNEADAKLIVHGDKGAELLYGKLSKRYECNELRDLMSGLLNKAYKDKNPE
ncbi:MAG: hypothetical protein HY811_10890 [Planctomycetes bacterium]|nr:hypothetical protein [Planctomycetota bacterium]